MEVCNVVKFQDLRQRKDTFNKTFQRKLQVSKDFIKRLGLESELKGHSGCVNCLQWNDTGDLLASGSDDLSIMLWTPFLSKRLHTIQSGHYGNIFSVKFVPGKNDTCIVSCAADFKILVNDYTCGETIYTCRCHNGRVKRLATTPNLANMFWSASEDGQVLQSDIRCPHSCSNTQTNVLINLTNHLGHTAEAKCIAINPVKSDLIAVGANDPYVRMYDRRMIKLTTPRFCTVPSQTTEKDDNLVPGCVSYFIAGHLPLKQRHFKRRFRSLTSTYVTFSPDGKDLLTNLGGEQIYLFNIISKRKKPVFNMFGNTHNHIHTKKSEEGLKIDCDGEHSPSGSNSVATDEVKHPSDCLHSSNISSTPTSQQKLEEKCNLPPKIDDIRKVASQAFERKNFPVAITLYSSAIASCPKSACLYSSRAAAYIKRAWDGDYYAAIRDCLTALELDAFHLTAHFRLIQCLHTLRWAKEAFDCIQAFKLKFPDSINSKSFEVIENDVKMAVFSQKKQSSQNNSTVQRSDNELPEAEDGEDNTIGDFQSNDSEDDEAGSSTSGRDALFQCLHTFNFSCLEISNQEKAWRTSAYDYEYRYCGHCNTTTDIKEANFFGSYGEYIIAGSDDGLMFFWERVSTNIVRVLRGDDSIVNCLQPHPSNCMLATSGIDPVVRLWSPRPEDGSRDEREILDQDDAAFANQRRMNTDPLEVMLRNMGYRVPNVNIEEMDEGQPGGADPTILCRTS